MDFYLGQNYAFHVMTKSIGSSCNLDCTYCYYLEKQKLYPKERDFKMSPEVLETFIRQYIESQHIPVVSFVWQGGEPCLLGIDYFKLILELQKKYADGRQIVNSFQTNGTLLNHEWCQFFKDNDFLVGISIDGPEKIHDYYRKAKSGAPTWQKVMKGIQLLHEYEVEFNTLTVVNDKVAENAMEVYRFLKDIGSQYLQFIPVVERRIESENRYPLSLVSPDHGDDAQVTDWSVTAEQYGKFLIIIFDEWVRSDVGIHFVQIFDATLASWAGEDPGICVYQETCGNALVMEHNGDLFSCDHYVYPENQLGNIMNKGLIEMVNTPKHINFGKSKADLLPNICLQCEFKFACNGECPKHSFIKSPEGEPGLNYLCKGLKMYYEHVAPYMDFMVNELNAQRPPANIMKKMAGLR